ncbi:hypothetical protein [Nostoc sp. GT001]|uniref:hypothetical protein n=1 Tax=Nostoc sp. GT001 TaxID=3056647 RepID=UPI0025AA827F|nr:hypothetical protein [Nostoc sp. GT001]MDM9583679.1 hypothetical protein [Nostoc sp. GT001]
MAILLNAMPAAGVAIAASTSLRNALDELKNSGLCQVSSSPSARRLFHLSYIW